MLLHKRRTLLLASGRLFKDTYPPFQRGDALLSDRRRTMFENLKAQYERGIEAKGAL